MRYVIILGDSSVAAYDDRFDAYEALFKWKELDQTAKLGLVAMRDGDIVDWLV